MELDIAKVRDAIEKLNNSIMLTKEMIQQSTPQDSGAFVKEMWDSCAEANTFLESSAEAIIVNGEVEVFDEVAEAMEHYRVANASYKEWIEGTASQPDQQQQPVPQEPVTPQQPVPQEPVIPQQPVPQPVEKREQHLQIDTSDLMFDDRLDEASKREEPKKKKKQPRVEQAQFPNEFPVDPNEPDPFGAFQMGPAIVVDTPSPSPQNQAEQSIHMSIDHWAGSSLNSAQFNDSPRSRISQMRDERQLDFRAEKEFVPGTIQVKIRLTRITPADVTTTFRNKLTNELAEALNISAHRLTIDNVA